MAELFYSFQYIAFLYVNICLVSNVEILLLNSDTTIWHNPQLYYYLVTIWICKHYVVVFADFLNTHTVNLLVLFGPDVAAQQKTRLNRTATLQWPQDKSDANL